MVPRKISNIASTRGVKILAISGEMRFTSEGFSLTRTLARIGTAGAPQTMM